MPDLFHISLQQAWTWRQWNKKAEWMPVSRASFTIEGKINSAVVAARLKDVVAAHEVLRTRFELRKEFKVPFQAVESAMDVTWECVDLRSYTPTQQESQIRCLSTKVPSGINSIEGPVIGGRLVQLAEENFHLQLFAGCLTSDAVSLVQIAKSILRADNRPAEHTEILQYADFTGWQSELFSKQSGDDAGGAEYWAREAASAHTFKPQVLLGIRGLNEKLDSSSVIQSFPKTKVQQVCERNGLDERTLLLTAWIIFLQRMSQQEQLLTGVFSMGRNYPELKDAIGLFARYLPLETRLDLSKDGIALNREVADKLKRSEDYEGYYDPETFFRLASQKTHFAYGFSYFQQEDFVLEDLKVKFIGADIFLEPLFLELSCFAQEGNISLEVKYPQSVYTSSHASLLLHYYQTLLDNFLENPESPAERLSLISTQEKARLLTQYQKDHPDLPFCGKTFQELFEEEVERNPNRIAIESKTEQISYGELNIVANRLANYLQRNRVKSETVVGICLPRCADMVVAILAILKAGGAYLPLDPSYPVERLRFMSEDSGVLFLITTPEIAAKVVPSPNKIEVMHLPDLALSLESTNNLPTRVSLDNAAYLIYTSGSTGMPKATVVTHRGLSNYLQWSAHEYRLSEGAGSLVHSSIAFDLTVTSLLSPLVAGQKVYLVPEGGGVDELLGMLRRQKDFSVVKITPAHLAILNEVLRPDDVGKGVRAFVIGGEQLLTEMVQLWRTHAPESRLINEYGPTETVVGCCIYEVKPGDPAVGPVKIGHPIARTEIYLLDGSLEPVPVGVPGEIYIGGEGVARGYLGRPEQTASRFVPNPFSSREGERLYRTGDMAFYQLEGAIEYIGRIDEQVKINGFRVELSEIENQIRSIPGVAEAIVLLTREKKGLVAYIRSNKTRTITASDLRDLLKQKLPQFMVPGKFMFLEQFPLTENGKIDKSALPDPDVSIGDLTPPKTETEQNLVNIWKDVLKLQNVGIHDDFFELGGHSLHATQIVSRIRERTGRDLPVRSLFQNSTIALLAQLIDSISETITLPEGLPSNSIGKGNNNAVQNK